MASSRQLRALWIALTVIMSFSGHVRAAENNPFSAIIDAVAGALGSVGVGAGISAPGIPVCAAGTTTCGLGGCYSPLLAACGEGDRCYASILGGRGRGRVLFVWGEGAAAARDCGLRAFFCADARQQLAKKARTARNTHQSQLHAHAGVMSTQPIECLPYVNACGGGKFCSTGFTCSSDGSECVPLPGGPVATGAAAGAWAQRGGALASCHAARGAARACAGDASPLARSEAAKLGYAAASPATECFESAAFKCCAIAGGLGGGGGAAHLAYGCKGAALLESAVAGALNGTARLARRAAVVANNVTAQFGAAAEAAGRANGGGSGGSALGQQQQQQGGDAAAAASAPLFQPLLASLGGALRNASAAVLAPLKNATLLHGVRDANGRVAYLNGPPGGAGAGGGGGVAPGQAGYYGAVRSSGAAAGTTVSAAAGAVLLLWTLAA